MGTRGWAFFSGRSGVWLVGVGLGLAGACGGESKDPPLNPTGAGAVGGTLTGSGGRGGSSSGGAAGKGGKGGAAGTAGTTGEGGDAGEMVTMPGAPVVEVTSPSAVSDPDDGGVLVEDEVTVRCQARAAAGSDANPLDPSTVSIQLLDADDNVVDEVLAGPTGEPDEFSARLILTQVVDNGVVGFRCTAGDTSSPPLLGSDTVHTFVDHGPLIVVTSPVPDSTHALEAALRVRFSVNPAPVARSDSGAAVDEVTLRIGGASIDPEAPDQGDFDVSVNLADPMVFPNAPSGVVPVTIRATNRRDPAAERVLTYDFVIDGKGPVITVLSPDEGDVVGQTVPIQFSVVDELSTVDLTSLVVQVNQRQYFYDDTWTVVGDVVTYRMDSTQAEEDSRVQAQITIRASDEVGNAATERTLNLYLDNEPPTVDLDPENVRDSRERDTGFECTEAFDPVGPRAANDYPKYQYTGEITVARTPTFRAIVWEETNSVPDIPLLKYSGTDEGSVQVYLQPVVATPLLVDRTGDGICDDLDRTAYSQNLTAMEKEGSAWYKLGDELSAPLIAGECELADETKPSQRCLNEASDMRRIIPHKIDGYPPVIYAIAPVPNSSACTGTYWEIGTSATEGWVCLAAVAKDFAGNVGISPPLRLCYDDPDTAFTPTCADGSETPPDCTDGCTPPPHYSSRIFSPE